MPLIPLRGLTVFPGMVISFPVGRDKSLQALSEVEGKDEHLFVVTQKDTKVVSPTKEDLYSMGTVSKVKQVLKLPGNITHVILEGVKRGRLLKYLEEEECDFGEIIEYEQDFDDVPSAHVQALMKVALENFESYAKIVQNTNMADAIIHAVTAEKPGELADIMAAGMDIPVQSKLEIQELLNPVERLERMIQILYHELEVLRIKKEIEQKVKERVDKSQREYYLREEMKVIQEELGDKDGVMADAEAFQKRLDEKNPPDYVKEIVEKEINRFKKIPVTSPESNISRSYIEVVLDLPWREETPEDFKIKTAEKILNQDHYGLEKVKERILEFLAVCKTAPKGNTPILCFVGPPGVGKTSIAKSVARALNRTYVRMSLGGVKDEAEIRGHRKTYIGAMPGRIISAMRQAKTTNPLLLLDEVDKLSVAYNGDPAAALLEVLDGEQNNTFRDHYVEMPYDLSKVLFICTANSLDKISKPLQDRMEMITLSSYTSEEKKNIALQHLLPKQLERHGLSTRNLQISPEAIDKIIDDYTREAGVRQLERVIGKICRKTVKQIFSGGKRSMSVTPEDLEDLLGIKKYYHDTIYDEPQVGIVRGLAWTQNGGDTLSIEVNTMKGTGRLELTGNLGNVMKESARAAISYIRGESHRFLVDENFYKEKDIHIHIPEGAVPKDGPSAGITMAAAMLSALTGAKIRHDVAMTGEITIRGRVLPIGGLKEKILAAKKAGIVRVILPAKNEGDLREIPDIIKEGLELVLVHEIEEVMKYALAEGESIWK